MHRPSNVDNIEGVNFILSMLDELVKKCIVVFPIHPRSRLNIELIGLWDKLTEIDGVVITVSPIICNPIAAKQNLWTFFEKLNGLN